MSSLAPPGNDVEKGVCARNTPVMMTRRSRQSRVVSSTTSVVPFVTFSTHTVPPPLVDGAGESLWLPVQVRLGATTANVSSAHNVFGVNRIRGWRNGSVPFPDVELADGSGWLFIAWSHDHDAETMDVKVSALGGDWGDEGSAQRTPTTYSLTDGLAIGWQSGGTGQSPDDTLIAAVCSYSTQHAVDAFEAVYDAVA